MPKIIKYKVLSEVNYGTLEASNIEKLFLDYAIKCNNQAAYDANYSIAEKEAISGTLEVIGEFETEEEFTIEDRVAELESAFGLLLEGSIE